MKTVKTADLIRYENTASHEAKVSAYKMAETMAKTFGIEVDLTELAKELGLEG